MTSWQDNFIDSLGKAVNNPDYPHPHDGAIYPDHRSQAIVRGVWNLTAEEIGANLQFIVKRRASVREFMNLLNTEHGWKHRIAYP